MKKNILRIFVLQLLLLSLSSCFTMKPQVVVFEETFAPSAVYQLGSIAFEGADPYAGLEDQIRDIQISSAHLSEFALLGDKPGRADFRVDVLYRDVEIIKGFRRIHSLALVLTVLDIEDRIVAKVFATEEGDSSFESLKTLLRLTKRSWSSLAKELGIS